MSANKEHYHDEIEPGQRRTKQHPIGWLNMPGFKSETWNPIVGCDKVINSGKWNGKTALVKSALDKPMKWKEPRMIFVCSMSDLFHETVTSGMFQMVLDRISRCRKHIFILLTKRPENVMPLMKYIGWGLPFPPNVWIGVTAENQEQANKRIPILLQIPAAKHFVSIEPMLGPVDLRQIPLFANNPLRWVICGGETGPKARPMHPDWVRSLRDQCKAAGTPFFFKQWGTWCPEGTIKDYNFLIPSKEVVRGIDVMTRKPVVRNHDTLDGQQHHEWPKTVS